MHRQKPREEAGLVGHEVRGRGQVGRLVLGRRLHLGRRLGRRLGLGRCVDAAEQAVQASHARLQVVHVDGLCGDRRLRHGGRRHQARLRPRIAHGVGRLVQMRPQLCVIRGKRLFQAGLHLVDLVGGPRSTTPERLRLEVRRIRHEGGHLG